MAFVKLHSKNFKALWAEWWGEENIPALEVDLLVVLKSTVIVERPTGRKNLGSPCLWGIEVKYFKPGDKKNFYAGLSQTLAYFCVGLDKASLLHVFSTDYPKETAATHAKTVRRLIEALELPITYAACRILEQEKFERLDRGSPEVLPIKSLFRYFAPSDLNPLYYDISYGDKAIAVRQTLMALLQIPTTP